MILPPDCDLIVFLWTTGVAKFGSKPRLRKKSLPIPAHYQREVVEDSLLSEPQKNILTHWTSSLPP
jgi:hypothetical protein